MSPYDLEQYIGYRGIRAFIKISSPSIYKKIIVLHKKGYLDMRIERNSEMPEKKIYSVNTLGEEYIKKLMTNLAESMVPVYFDFNAFIAFLGLADQGQAFLLLDKLQGSLKESRAHVEEVLNRDKAKEGYPPMPLSGKQILKQQLAVYDTLINWLKNFKKAYNKDNAS